MNSFIKKKLIPFWGKLVLKSKALTRSVCLFTNTYRVLALGKMFRNIGNILVVYLNSIQTWLNKQLYTNIEHSFLSSLYIYIYIKFKRQGYTEA